MHSYGKIKIWSNESVLLRTISASVTNLHGIELLPNGNIITSDSMNGITMTVWNVTTGLSVLTLQGHTSTVYPIELVDSDQTIASGSVDKTIRLWNISTGSLLSTINVSANVYSLKVLPNGLLASGDSLKLVRLWTILSTSGNRSLSFFANLTATI